MGTEANWLRYKRMGKMSLTSLLMIVEPQVIKFCGPLFFATSTASPKDNIVNSGSFGLVSIGHRKLLVTCCHVLEAFKEKHAENPALQFGFAFGTGKLWAIEFGDLMASKVDDSRRCDLATIDVSDAVDLVSGAQRDFFDLNSSPPPKVKEGDILYLIGFPAKGRIETDTAVGWPRQPLGVMASQVGESRFYARPKTLKLDATEYGGMSGSPCFVVREGAPIELVGFFTGLAPNDMNLLEFTYARFIGKDGIIRYHN